MTPPFRRTAGPGSPAAGGRSNSRPEPSDYFPVHLTGGNSTDGFTGFEVWLDPDHAAAEVVGGRVLSTAQPGFFLDGSNPTASVESPVLAKARLGPGVGGRAWELEPFGSSSSGSFACASDFWLTTLGDNTCWTLYRRGGDGRCSCFGTDDPTDAAAGVVMVYDTVLGGWIGVKPNTPGSPAMVSTCCGCGVAVLATTGGVAFQRATLTLRGVHVACPDPDAGSGSGSGAGEAPFTEVLTNYCPVVLDDGRRGLLFFGESTNICGGTRSGCGNEIRILVVCGAECPEPICECEGCYDCYDWGAAIAFFADLTGFTDNDKNGSWVWAWAEGCTWAASCEGASSTIEFVTGSPNKWRLTHDDSVYELDADDWLCTGENEMAKQSGDGPATVTVRAIMPSDPAITCFDHPDLVATVTIEGCGEMVFNFEWVDDGFAHAYEQLPPSPTAGECACPGTGIETWSATVICLVNGDLQFTMGAPTGETDDVVLTIVSRLPVFLATGSGTMTCGDPTPTITAFTVEITQA